MGLNALGMDVGTEALGMSPVGTDAFGIEAILINSNRHGRVRVDTIGMDVLHESLCEVRDVARQAYVRIREQG